MRPAAHLQWLYRKSSSKVKHLVCSRLYRDTNHDIRKSIIIAGMGRSGTTWLANILASQLPCRIIWEPFNPHAVEAFGQFNDFHYQRVADPAPELYAYVDAVLKGNLRDKWMDREISRIFIEYRLVKEIRANLFLKWLINKFPKVPLVFIVRHPCAIVLSRMEANWDANGDLDALLSQADLIDDILYDKMDIINNARTIEARHAVLWSIQHLVPIRQFRSRHLNTVFYEDLCLQPEVEIPKIFRFIGQEYQDAVFKHVEQPSRTVMRTSSVLTGEDKVSRWSKTLSQTQIRSILDVVKDFELDYVYGDSVTPLVEAL